jgi:chromate transporter
MNSVTPKGQIKEVALLFLKLGAFSFAGPAAYIAIMQREVARDRRWVDDQEFLDLVGATNIIPGPNATEMAIHLGLRRAAIKDSNPRSACEGRRVPHL